MPIDNFYGGRQGQNFYISKVFPSYTALQQDLGDGYKSSIGFGEYVMINYGAPTGYGYTQTIKRVNDDNQENLPAINVKNVNELQKAMGDIKKATIEIVIKNNEWSFGNFGKDENLLFTEYFTIEAVKTYVTKFWNTDYEDTSEEFTNETFQFTFSFTDESIQNLNIDKSEGYSVNYNNTIWKKISASEEDKAEEKIKIQTWYEPEGKKEIGYELVTYLGGNIPTLTAKSNIIDANLNPSVSQQQATIDNPVFTFNLPKSQILGLMPEDDVEKFLGTIDTIDYDSGENVEPGLIRANADQAPELVYDDTDVNNPKLLFKLPRSQKFIETIDYNEYTPMNDSEPTAQVVTSDGTVDNVDINHPQIKIHLPRDIKFWSSDDTIDAIIESGIWNSDFNANKGNNDYGLNDYYIHNDTAYIYKIISVNNNEILFEYVGKLVQRAPDGWTIETLTTFDEKGNLNTFAIENSSNENHDWNLRLKAPKPVKFIEPLREIIEDSTAVPEVEQITNLDEDAYQLKFKLPRAPKWEVGEGEPKSQVSGDYYLDKETGKIYKDNIEVADITGPVGEPGAGYFVTDTLKFVLTTDINDNNSLTLNGEQVEYNTSLEETIQAYIENKYPANDEQFNKSNPMIAVEVAQYKINENSEKELINFTSYIYYVTSDKATTAEPKYWTRLQASGQAASLASELPLITLFINGGTLSDNIGL